MFDKVSIRLLAVLLGLALSLCGCETPGGGSTIQRTTTATYRVVSNLNKGLSESVNGLRSTAADLAARVEESESAVQRIQDMVEENQVRLAGLDAKLDEFRSTLYRHFGLTPPTATGPSPSVLFPDEGVVITPPFDPSERVAPTPVVPSAELPALPPVFPADSNNPNAEAHAQQILSRYEVRDYEGTIELSASYIEAYPNSAYVPNALFWQAQAYLKLARYPEAIAGYERLRAQYPKSGMVPASLRNQAKIHYTRREKIGRAHV